MHKPLQFPCTSIDPCHGILDICLSDHSKRANTPVKDRKTLLTANHLIRSHVCGRWVGKGRRVSRFVSRSTRGSSLGANARHANQMGRQCNRNKGAARHPWVSLEHQAALSFGQRVIDSHLSPSPTEMPRSSSCFFLDFPRWRCSDNFRMRFGESMFAERCAHCQF